MKYTLVTLFLLLSATATSAEPTYDVVIYGGTSGAVTAAVQTVKMGKTVIIISPDKHLGGLTSGGLGWTDSGKKEVVGGLSREFYQRVKKQYDKPESWVQQKAETYKLYKKGEDAIWAFEPHVAEQVYDAWCEELKVPVVRDAWLDRAKGVKKEGQRIVSITTLDGKTFAGRMFIDATYEGDLMAAAGVTYAVGREPNSQFGETLDGVQTAHARGHQFSGKIDPFVVRGDPKSGLLPLIHDGGPGEEGAGDKRIQAYNFRTCLTNVPENRTPFPRPDGYDPKQYELLLRTLVAGSRHVFGKFDMVPNQKTDTNNHGPFSTDNIGMNYDYPDASYERRREIIREHENYQKGFYYFICNDPRVPKDVHDKMNEWGLAKDEFADNGNWPHQIYVREARRMVGDFVVTELHVRRVAPTPDSIGMGSYNMDSHHTQRYVAHDPDRSAYARNEGDVEIGPGGPYPIGYRSIVPKVGECENLLVPVCVSATHIAYGSIRMEPVFMVLGQSSATAAVMAIDANIAVQKVDYPKLRERLLADKQVLDYDRPALARVPDKKTSIELAKLKGVVVDDAGAKITGEWTSAHTIGPFVAEGYRHDGNAEKGKKSARFEAKIPKDGRYEVRIAYSPNKNRASNVPVLVQSTEGEKRVTVNQQNTPPIDKLWITVGTFEFSSGKPAVVEISNANTDGYVIIDAVQFLPK